MTKVDLISEPEWLDLIELDIHEILEGTIFENAPVVRVSALENRDATIHLLRYKKNYPIPARS